MKVYELQGNTFHTEDFTVAKGTNGVNLLTLVIPTEINGYSFELLKESFPNTNLQVNIYWQSEDGETSGKVKGVAIWRNHTFYKENSEEKLEIVKIEEDGKIFYVTTFSADKYMTEKAGKVMFSIEIITHGIDCWHSGIDSFIVEESIYTGTRD